MTKWNLKPAPKPRTIGYGLKPADRKLYDRATLLWRAGAIADYYCGRRSPDDPTPVWRIDGAEWDMTPGAKGSDVRPDIARALDRAQSARGITAVEWAGQWCGYRQVRVTFTNGTRVTERYDGTRVVLDQAA